MKYDHLIGRQVIATAAKGFTFTGTLRHAQEVSVTGALEIVTPDGTVDFGGLPQAFATIEAADDEYLNCGATIDRPDDATYTCNRRVGHEFGCAPFRDA